MQIKQLSGLKPKTIFPHVDLLRTYMRFRPRDPNEPNKADETHLTQIQRKTNVQVKVIY